MARLNMEDFMFADLGKETKQRRDTEYNNGNSRTYIQTLFIRTSLLIRFPWHPNDNA